MQVFHGMSPPPIGPCTLTIGNFDGVHLGHIAMLRALKKMSLQHALPSVVLTFEPHPREYFNPDSAPARLSNVEEKLEQFEKIGIDNVWVLPFNQTLAQMPAETFIQTLLVRQLHTHYILVGDDFCFGYRRAGNLAMLKQAAQQYQFEVESFPSIKKADQRISSTLIRQALQSGEMALAQTLLGRPYSMSGQVVHGDKVGRTLGYPTANLHLSHSPPPLSGIFCVEVTVLDQVYQGVASLGIRPTLHSNSTFVLEAYIFDFNEMIYDQHIRIDFLKKLRDEMKYSDIESLKAQIAEDVKKTRAFFVSRSGLAET